jgi:hypothetical protein
MPGTHNFEHLALLLRQQGRAKLTGGGKTNPQTLANRNARAAHSASLAASAQSLSTSFQERQQERTTQGLQALPSGMPILLRVDTGLDLDALREKYAFEIVAEQEDGYVIVAAEDIDLAAFTEMVNGFAVQVHGSAMVAKVYRLFDDPSQIERLQQILPHASLNSGHRSQTIKPTSWTSESRAAARKRSQLRQKEASDRRTQIGPEVSRNGRKLVCKPMSIGTR